MSKRTKKLMILFLSSAMTLSPMGTGAGAVQTFAEENVSENEASEAEPTEVEDSEENISKETTSEDEVSKEATSEDEASKEEMSEENVSKNVISENEAEETEDEKIVKSDLEAIEIPEAEDIRGNIYLTESGENGSEITWESSRPDVISDKDEGEKKAGVVNRQDEDVEVTLKATAVYGEASESKEISVKVTKKAEKKKTTHYLFAHFRGEGYKTGEQIYFDDSKDGLHWNELNDGKPVLTSTLGEKGLRDPFIIRSPEGDKFYLIATDLKINGNGNWSRAVNAGSKYIEIFESTDLVNWKEQREALVSIPEAGCTWAPEAFYDEERGEYFVFWASHVDGHHHIYYTTTRDFYNFSETKEWITLRNKNGDVTDIIDTTVDSVENPDGTKTFYRLSKVESGSNSVIDDGDPTGGKFEILEKSDSLYGNWTRVKSKFLNSQAHVEGGTMFKFNDSDRWCLLLDNYGGIGYYPSYTDDLSSGEFTRYDSSDYTFPSRLRHGTVIQITDEEYEAIGEKYGRTASEEEEEEVIDTSVSLKDSALANITFDGTDALEADGLKITAENGYAVEDNDELEGKALVLDGKKKQWLDVKTDDDKSLLSGKKTITFNYWSKVTDKSKNNRGWTIFAANNGNSFSWPNETYFGIIDALPNAAISDKGLTVQRFNDKGSRSDVNNTTNVGSDWKMVTAVATEKSTTLYVNGKKVSKVSSKIPLTDLFGNESDGALQIGKANWDKGEYFSGMIDNITIYDRAITDDEVKAIYDTKSYTGKVEKNYTLKKAWGKTFCVDEDGNRATGFVTVDGVKYYFDADRNGAMKKSAFFDVEENGKKYTFRALRDGSIAVGFVKTWNATYYFDENSHMVKGEDVVIDGKTYTFAENGKLVK